MARSDDGGGRGGGGARPDGRMRARLRVQDRAGRLQRAARGPGRGDARPASPRRPASRSTLRNGSDFELANQIVQEGAASPADVFLTENSPAMTHGRQTRACSPRSTRTRWRQVPAAVRVRRSRTGSASRPARRCWPTTPSRCRRPAAGVDHGPGRPGLEGPGRHRPVRRRLPGDRQRGARARRARARPQAWLKGLKANAQDLPATTCAIMAAVNAGEIQAGIIYHYYWYQDQAESGANSKNVAAPLLRQPGPGRVLSASRAPACSSRASTRRRRRSWSTT